MAFKMAKMRPLAERTVEEYPGTNAEAIVIGEALVLTSGALTKCAADSKPEFISVSAGTSVPIKVYRVLEEDVYETTFAADASAVDEGTKVTLHTDGLQVTATATNGDALIVKKLGSGEIGTKVLVSFR